MAGCDGWITFKIFELLGATFCMIYKRVTDDEANKLFYFLQKYSREWPLLNNVTWEENGAIFTDITYGGYIIIVIGLIISQCSGELQRAKKLENFFLLVGALLFIAAGSLELASIESVEERLVDNAAILGVVSLLTGFLFIIDFLTAGKRRKREKVQSLRKMTTSKPTQTEGKCPPSCPHHVTTGVTDMNGNLQRSATGADHGMPRIPKNAVKLLPSSPELSEYLLTSEKHANQYLSPSADYYTEPPIIDENELKTHEGKIRYTESFLRSEKGLYPKLRRGPETPGGHFIVPAGYVLVPAEHFQARSPTLKSDSGIGESYTPPGYAQIIPSTKYKGKKDPSSYVISVDEDYLVKNQRGSSRSSQHRSSPYKTNSSETSDFEDSRPGEDRYHEYDERDGGRNSKKIAEYSEVKVKGHRYIPQSEDSSDEQKTGYHESDEYSRSASRFSQRSKDWDHKGRTGDKYSEEKVNLSGRETPYRSSTPFSSREKLKSILRLDYKSPKKESGLHFPKDVQYDSLDGKKIAEDLKTLREIAKSDLNLSRSSAVEKGKRASGKLEVTSDDEKDRRMSEREEQYFGLKDLRQSHKERKFDPFPSLISATEKSKRKSKGEESRAAREEKEFGDLIDEKFYFLDEEDKARKLERRSPLQKDYLRGLKPKSDSDDNTSPSTDDEIRLRMETPGGASYKSEAMVWVDDSRESRTPTSTPITPASPGYVLYTAQNWPESQSPSPQDRFQFNAKEAQGLSVSGPGKTSLLERLKTTTDFSSVKEETAKGFQKSRMLDFESERTSRSGGLLARKTDEAGKKPSVVAGSTSTWKKWLQSKPKLVPTKSAPN